MLMVANLKLVEVLKRSEKLINPYLEILARAAGAFILVVVITRIMGKHEVGKLTITDFVTGIIIGSIAASLVVELNEPPWYYVFGLFMFMVITITFQWAGMKYRPLHKLLNAEPTVVVHNGKILEKNMRIMRYTMNDLTSQLRHEGYFDIADVEFAILEPNGDLSVLAKSQAAPLTARSVNIPTKYQGVPSELVVDGKIIQQNLKQNNLDEEWLRNQLRKQGFHSLKDVFYVSLDTGGNLYVDKRKDQLDYVQDITDKLPGKAPQ